MTQVIQLQARSGKDGRLHLDIPVDTAEGTYAVVVVLQPASDAPAVPPARQWPPGFIEQTAGAWQGELVREPQGEYERREEL